MSLAYRVLQWIARTTPIILVLLFIADRSIAQQDTLAETTTSTSDSQLLNRSTHSVWYDAQKNEINPTSTLPRNIDASDRHTSIASPKNTAINTGSGANWLSDFFSYLFRGWQSILVICLLMLLAIVIFALLSKNNYISTPFPSKQRTREKTNPITIRDLPFELEQTQLGLLAQAEQYRNAGDYSKAIIYLFSHVLVELDGARCIRLERGKTNRTYVRELGSRHNLVGFTKQLVGVFEYVFFGKNRLNQDTFESIWKQIPEFETNLELIAGKQKPNASAASARASS
jgi:hypothetical protein